MLAKIRRLESRIRELEQENAELNLTLKEMYFYGQDLVERVRMEPIEATILRVESQTSDASHAARLRVMKKDRT
jgi:hypothetical protein